MKILFITRKFPPSVGGMENFSYQLIDHFKKDKNRANEIKTIVLGKKQLHLIWFFPYVVMRLVFNSLSYDVIHLGDGLIAGAAWFPKIFYKIFFPRRRPRYVVTLHGLDVTYPNLLYQLYFKWFCRSLDKYICISKHTIEVAKKAGIRNLVQIPNGVNLKSFSRQRDDDYVLGVIKKKYNIHADRKIILTIGRLVKRKGVLWFIENVFPFLSTNCHYIIIGSGPFEKNLRDSIEKLDSSTAQRISLGGRVSEEEIHWLYQAADAFIMPNIPVSGDMEGFGLVALEASLSGLIVFASNLEGIKDAIYHKENGFLLEPEEPAAWIKGLNYFLGASESFEWRRKAFSQFTAENFCWDTIVIKYLNVFSESIIHYSQ